MTLGITPRVANYFHLDPAFSGRAGRGARYSAALLCTLLFVSSAPAQTKAPEPRADPRGQTNVKPRAPAAAAQPRKPAADAPQPASSGEHSNGEKDLQEIYACVAQGLPDGWQRAWVTVRELPAPDRDRTFEARFQVSLDRSGEARWNFVPCNARDVGERVYRLNQYLEPEKRNWKTATLLFMREGKFELKYDYTPDSAPPAAKN